MLPACLYSSLVFHGKDYQRSCWQQTQAVYRTTLMTYILVSETSPLPPKLSVELETHHSALKNLVRASALGKPLGWLRLVVHPSILCTLLFPPPNACWQQPLFCLCFFHFSCQSHLLCHLPGMALIENTLKCWFRARDDSLDADQWLMVKTEEGKCCDFLCRPKGCFPSLKTDRKAVWSQTNTTIWGIFRLSTHISVVSLVRSTLLQHLKLKEPSFC